MDSMNDIIKLLEFSVKLMGVLIIVLMFIYVRILSAKSKMLKKEMVDRKNDYDEKNNQEYNDLNNNDPINYYDNEKTDL